MQNPETSVQNATNFAISCARHGLLMLDDGKPFTAASDLRESIENLRTALVLLEKHGTDIYERRPRST